MSSSPPKTAVLAFDPCNLAAYNVSNPYDQNYSAISSDNGASITIMMDILPDQIKPHNGSKPPRLGNTTDAVEYYQLTVLKHDLSVSEILIASAPSDASNIERLKIIRVSDSVEVTEVRAFDSFVASDKEADNALTPILLAPSKNRLRCGKSGTKQKLKDSWTLDLAWLHKDLQRHISVNKISFAAALNALVATCEQSSKHERPLPRSLFELVDSDFFVEDIDMASDSLVDMIQKLGKKVSGDDDDITESEVLTGQSFTPSLCESWGIGDSFTLSRVYEILIIHWLKPLSPKTPSRVRISIERVARAVAAQLCLAAFRYPASLHAPIEHTVTKQQNAAQREVVLALRHRASATEFSPKRQQMVQPADLFPAKALREGKGNRPTSPRKGARQTPDATPSIRFRSSSLSPHHTESLASQRLGTRVRLEPQLYDGDSTASILKHWDEGVDPWSYDWESAQQAIDSESQANFVGESSSTQNEPKAEQPHKRRRVESTGTSSQPPPNRSTNSQPVTNISREPHGSSQPDLPTLMSQPEPGHHGSRKLTRAKKQIAGFRN
ncbi:MAG: hypothetical protein Q9191_004570 [Dirinaria sp. TL-2023a]